MFISGRYLNVGPGLENSPLIVSSSLFVPKVVRLLTGRAKSLLSVFCREKMAQAYDFALDKIGMDIQSYSIWNDYVTFLKGVEAIGSYAENQKITAVRKVGRLHFVAVNEIT